MMRCFDGWSAMQHMQQSVTSVCLRGLLSLAYISLGMDCLHKGAFTGEVIIPRQERAEVEKKRKKFLCGRVDNPFQTSSIAKQYFSSACASVRCARLYGAATRIESTGVLKIV